MKVIYEELVEKILKFEKVNEKKLFNFSFRGIRLYPIIRWALLTSIILKEQGFDLPHATKQNIQKWYFKTLKSLFKGFFLYNPYWSSKHDLFIISDARRRTRLFRKKYFDVIHDPLIEESKMDGIIFERPFQGLHKLPAYTENLIFSEPLSFFSKLTPGSKFDNLNYISKKYIKKIEELINENFHIKDIRLTARSFSHTFVFGEKLMKIIKKTSPKLIIILTGSYGGVNAYVIKKCKELGIKTVEFQHGHVGKHHLAYNYGIEGPEYKDYLPDYFLTFGQYWNDQLTRYPSKKIVIGNPELAYQINARDEIKEEKEILIISQGTVTDKMVSLTKRLRKILPDSMELIFRLHPGEVPFEDRYKELYNIKGIVIDKNSNIFDLIKRSRAVVGYNSTTLFEVLAFKKPIFVMKSDASDAYIPKEIGERFNNAEDLAEKIKNHNEYSKNIDWSYYWELDWKSRFRKFLKEIGLE